nr:uncharacterized protein LOC104265352 [Ciona intestinalis]|eukprot:XP_009857447.1 uncharacterized protein LOC104265352 [Ciona intestinalis]
MKSLVFNVVLILSLVRMRSTEGHGRLLQPPSRSSMWRYKYTDPMLSPYAEIIQSNYDDNGLNCGGKNTQTVNEGRCGVCGDSYTAAVKENEAGGKYALGIIGRIYSPGEIIDTQVEITAEHKGYFEFRLCPWDNVHVPVTHECLNQRLLSFADGEKKWYLPQDADLAKGVHNIKVQLPSDVLCEQCVLQWRYRTGNSWGYEDGKEGMGLGQQEEFYGCSDVAIRGNIQPSTTFTVPTTRSTVTPEMLSTTRLSVPLSTTTKTLSSSSVSTSTKNPGVASSTMTSSTTSTIGEHVVTDSTQTPSIATPPDCSQVMPGKMFFRDCHSFYICAHSFLPPYNLPCPEGTVYSRVGDMCDHPYLVDAPCGYL